MATGESITQLLRDWSQRSPGAVDQLMPLVFDELRLLARSHFRREATGHTLQPTAIINELYLRLLNQRSVHLANRTDFFAFSSRIIRRILVDHYRKKQKIKRGGGAPHVTLDEALGLSVSPSVDLLALDRALDDLQTLDPRQHRVVELRFFGGLTHPQIAEALELSEATVKRDWNMARAWLLRRMEN